jgi:DNA-binding FadR family transcriptional regulator
VANAGLAAERAGPDAIEALQAAAARLQLGLSAEAAAVADVDFHRQIATATGNQFFELLLDSIREVLLTVQLPTLAEPKIVRSARRAHNRILKEIASGDPEAARAAMRAHLAEAERGLRAVLRSRPSSARIA